MADAKRERREEAQPADPAAAAAALPASVAAVLGNDDLLAEILLRLGSTAWLLRAALVRRRWLRVASATAFLARFRARHPPRALGIMAFGIGIAPVLYPARHPPELAAAFARAAASLGPPRGYDKLMDYRGGRILIGLCDWGDGDGDDDDMPLHGGQPTERRVRSLVRAAPDVVLPPLPRSQCFPGDHTPFLDRCLFLLDDDSGGGASCLYLLIRTDKVRVRAGFSFLRSGVWGAEQSAVTAHHNLFGDILVSGTKVYMMTTGGCILVLDLEARSFSTINLPDGVGRYPPAGMPHLRMTLRFSRAQGPGVYLVEAAWFQLRVWRCDGVKQWVLVRTVAVREACDHLDVQAWEPGDGQGPPVLVLGVGDNAELVVLQLVASEIICCMDLANGVVENVLPGRRLYRGSPVHPIAMVWPPVFPVLDNTSEEP
ncbi:hypothetical protein ACP4OV_017404 [Aristida adscensionis]